MASIKKMKQVKNIKTQLDVRTQFEAYMLNVGFTEVDMRREHADNQYSESTVHNMYEGYCAALATYEGDVDVAGDTKQ